MNIKDGDKIKHEIYGTGTVVSDPAEYTTHQFSGAAAWCVFNNPKTGISGGYPYCIPTNDLIKNGEGHETE